MFTRKEAMMLFFAAILTNVGVFVSITWLVLQVIDCEYSISDFVFYSSTICSLELACSNFVYEISSHYKSMLFINKLFDFLNLKMEIKSGTKKISNKKIHTLEFKNVSFLYPNSNKFILKDINFKIKTGEKITLVGKNGCGKTTLINLILRTYDPTKGAILLDGINIKNYEYKNYVQFFTAIFQDYQTYAVKMGDYISFGSIKNKKDILKIKQSAVNSALNFIEDLPKGFNSNLTTLFDKQGVELSGGQWQKLAISRMFFSCSHIMIFDEPTSSLDSISESKILKNIEHLGKDKIVLLISHKMHPSILANRIIYLENGKIINDGPHKKLMKETNGYKKLFEKQNNAINKHYI